MPLKPQFEHLCRTGPVTEIQLWLQEGQRQL
jgi:hypothetical protein